jgi:hypothetical protein
VNRSAQVSSLAARGLAVQHVIEPLGLTSLSVPPGEEPATVSALRQLPEVEFAELDYLAQVVVAPGDPAWANQWSLLQIGLPRMNAQGVRVSSSR